MPELGRCATEIIVSIYYWVLERHFRPALRRLSWNFIAGAFIMYLFCPNVQISCVEQKILVLAVTYYFSRWSWRHEEDRHNA